MPDEISMILRLAAVHRTRPFLADAERVGDILLSMDGFSRDEDFFADSAPEVVGHDMAVAACSDILACGATPEFLLQAWNMDPADPPEHYEEMARSIQNVLDFYGAVCIGGDMGTASPWSWTATVGTHVTGRAVQRVASERIPFDLYVSGTVGDANLAMASHAPMPRFELRAPVPPCSLFATDTSGGFCDALENIRRCNPDISVSIDVLPLTECSGLPFPEELLLIGGVGEYELLFAVPHGQEAEGICIGHGEFSGGVVHLPGGGVMLEPPPDYRAIPQEHWMNATLDYYRRTFL